MMLCVANISKLVLLLHVHYPKMWTDHDSLSGCNIAVLGHQSIKTGVTVTCDYHKIFCLVIYMA